MVGGDRRPLRITELGTAATRAQGETSRRGETWAALLRYLDSTRRVLTGRNRDDERRRFCRFLAATATHRYAWHLTCSRRVLPGLSQAESDAIIRKRANHLAETKRAMTDAAPKRCRKKIEITM